MMIKDESTIKLSNGQSVFVVNSSHYDNVAVVMLKNGDRKVIDKQTLTIVEPKNISYVPKGKFTKVKVVNKKTEEEISFSTYRSASAFLKKEKDYVARMHYRSKNEDNDYWYIFYDKKIK